MLVGSLGASFLGNMLTEKGMLRARTMIQDYHSVY